MTVLFAGKIVHNIDIDRNKIDSKELVECRLGKSSGSLSKCWSTYGCYVSQVYERGTRRSRLITYGCIRNTEVRFIDPASHF